MSPAGHAHGRVAARLTISLGLVVEQNSLGAVYAAETGFVLSRHPDTVRAPDVAFVRGERLASAPAEGFFPGPPDLAVEVVSPTDTYSAVEEKVFGWLEAGCRAVVVLDPRRQVASVYRSRQSILDPLRGRRAVGGRSRARLVDRPPRAVRLTTSEASPPTDRRGPLLGAPASRRPLSFPAPAGETPALPGQAGAGKLTQPAGFS